MTQDVLVQRRRHGRHCLRSTIENWDEHDQAVEAPPQLGYEEVQLGRAVLSSVRSPATPTIVVSASCRVFGGGVSATCVRAQSMRATISSVAKPPMRWALIDRR
jgi:hypothetical protein